MTCAVSDLASFISWGSARSAVAGGLCFAGPEAEYGIGLEVLLEDYRVACLADTPAASLLAARGIETFVLDRQGPETKGARPRSTLALLEDPATVRWLEAQFPAGMPALLVFKSSYQLELLCAERGWSLLSASAKLARRWENKLAFHTIAEGLGLSQARGLILDADQIDYRRVSAELGRRFVLQAAHGFSGSKTWLISSAHDLQRLKSQWRSRRLKATAYVDGRPLTLNACVTARGVACSAPFVQVTGHSGLTRHRLGSCGNDWTLAGQLELEHGPFVSAAECIGRALGRDGYRGLFGVDFILTEAGEAVVIEVNPRLVASVALHAQLEIAAGRLPLLARHVLAHVDPDSDQASLDLHLEPLSGGQVILHNLAPDERKVMPWLMTGRYDARDGVPFQYIGPATRVDELQDPSELLLLAPESGRVVQSGQAWGRLQASSAVQAEDGKLLPAIEHAVSAVQARVFTDQPPSDPPVN